ncbi:rod shape-determining protein MreD [Patescibacteria group bacterium]|nr:rod shape-determining protein MreD [Patescibacteria group bacterium]
MKIIYIILFIIILLFLQIGILPHLKILGVFPNLIIISILSLSILKEWKKNFVWIIIAGLFLDVYSLNNIIGVSIISLLGAGILVYFLNQNTFKKANILSLIITFLIGILAFYILSLILSLIFSFSFTFSIVLVIYNLILSLPVFWVMKKAIIVK